MSLIKLHAFSLFLLILLCTPSVVAAATVFDSHTFSASVVLKKVNGPYIFTGYNSIPKHVSVTFEAGSTIELQGQLYVYGKLNLLGAQYLQTKLNISGTGSRVSTIGGELYGEYISINTANAFLNAWASSTIVFKNSTIDSNSSGDSLVLAWQGSSVDVSNTTIKNSNAQSTFQFFGGAAAVFNDVIFDNVGETSVSVYGTQPVNGVNVKTTASFTSVQFYHPRKHGIEVFSNAYTKILGSTFSGFTGSAILTYGNASLDIENSIIQQNKIGIESYGSAVNVTDSDISLNTEYGALQSGGEFTAEGNWWGDETGPYNLSSNTNGKGDRYEGTGNFSPWLTQKKKGECCSNILFIPGLEASRIYKKGLTENQLWEPNRNTDVSKLFLSTNGRPLDSSLYTKDIIYKTNVGFGAQNVEVYSGLATALNQMTDKFTIRDWQYAAYDWRMSPNDIVLGGSRVSSNGQFITLEQQIDKLVQTSKTKKVTLIAHSYGGLVTKRLLTYLASKHKLSLIDKIIFVGVPEQGSPSALFALLHGDNQEIGAGFILSKNTARKLALNMPSAYALLPSIDTNPGASIIGTKSSATSIPEVQTVESMRRFLLNQIVRPFSNSTDAIHIPAVGNGFVYNKIQTEFQVFDLPLVVKQAIQNGTLGFFNILGVGLKTPKNIVYSMGNKNLCATKYGTNPTRLFAADAAYCALSHEQSFSLLGDGNVLLGDTLRRLGDLYFFKMNEFNSDMNKNYSHMNIVSAKPVVELMMQMMLGNVGYYNLPKYITHNQGSRYVGISQGQNTSSFDKFYEVQSSDSAYITTRDSAGNLVGIPANVNTAQNQSQNQVQDSINMDHVRVENSSPNSTVGQVGDTYIVSQSNLPQEIKLIPKQTDETISHVDIEVKSVQIDMVNDTEIKNQIFYFENIPMTEYSTIDIQVNQAVVGAVTSGAISIDPPAVLTVINSIGNVFQNTETYYPSTVGGQAYIAPVQTSGNSQNQSIYSQTNGGGIDILFLIESIRADIQKSSLRANFKQRYLLKLKSVEAYIKAAKATQIEAKMRTAAKYANGITVSLLAIIKDLNRYRSFYYRGGMNKAEAVFLYSEFIRLSQALTN